MTEGVGGDALRELGLTDRLIKRSMQMCFMQMIPALLLLPGYNCQRLLRNCQMKSLGAFGYFFSS